MDPRNSLVSLLLLAGSSRVPAFGVSFRGDASPHRRQILGRRQSSRCTINRHKLSSLNLGQDNSSASLIVNSTASRGRCIGQRSRSSRAGTTPLKSSLGTASTGATLCDQCGEASGNSPGLTVCAAPGCGVWFAQCPGCEAAYDGCCSSACQALAVGAIGENCLPREYTARLSRHSSRRGENSAFPLLREAAVTKATSEEGSCTPTEGSNWLDDRGSLSPLDSDTSRDEARVAQDGKGAEGKLYDGEGVLAEEAGAVLYSYASRHSVPESADLAAVQEATNRDQPRGAHMLSGHLQGEVLKLVARLCGAKRVLDIGTFTGYSALAFAEALPEDGTVVTLESDERAAETAKSHFVNSKHGGKIRLLLGKAMDSIDQLIAEGGWQFDVIFLDADKKSYWDYYNKMLQGPRPLLASGGILMADNVLFHGMVPLAEATVAEDGIGGQGDGGRHRSKAQMGGKGGDLAPTSIKPRRLKIARSLHDFNKRVRDDDRVEVLLLPLRDGLSVIRWREGMYPM